MTLTATWITGSASNGQLWMASDSRISDSAGTLIDEGAKLFQLPLVARSPAPNGFFDRETFATNLGLLCAGSTLIFQHVYATLVPTLSTLIGSDAVPSLNDVAAFVGRVTTLYTRSLGESRPRGAVASLVVGGRDPETGELQAYELAPQRDTDGLLDFPPRRLNLEDDRVIFTGDREAMQAADVLLADIYADPAPGRTRERAALNVIRELSLSDSFRTVGGDVQIGCTVGGDFRRFATVTPIVPGQSGAQMRLNNIDLQGLGVVGPCSLGLGGIVSP